MIQKKNYQRTNSVLYAKKTSVEKTNISKKEIRPQIAKSDVKNDSKLNKRAKRKYYRTAEKQPAGKKYSQKHQKYDFRKTIIRKTDNSLRIIPLGGCEEVGRNMTIFEYKNDIIILDMGLQFPEENMPGIDYIIPNIEYLKGKEKNIRGVILSHGHLDHIGAAPILLPKLNYPPIIGRDLTIRMTKHRLEDHEKGSSQKMKTILIKSVNDRLKIGEFNISFFQIEHSIMDAVGVAISTPHGTILHPGDWTLEKNDKGQPILDYKSLTRFPKPTILMLESLGSIDVRKSASSSEMKKNIEKIVNEAKGRVVIGTFSSQIERIGWILQLAEKLGKKVAIDGYSMKMNIEIARELGYIKYKKESVIKIKDVDNYPDKKIMILCTGAQGEGNAVLSRIIDKNHKYVQLRKNDTVVLSSSIIPGNERTIQRLKDNLYRQCDNVIHGSIMDIHVSGHGNREDIRYMLDQIRPTYFIPVYANHYMLKEAAKLAKEEIGYKDDKIIVPDNGCVIAFDEHGGKMIEEKVPANYVYVDGLGTTNTSTIVLRDRQVLAEDGMVVVIITVDTKTGRLIQNPDIISRGFVFLKENKELIEEVRHQVKKMVIKSDPLSWSNTNYIRNKIRDDVGKFLFVKTEKRPMILPVVIEV
ncbi:MAG: ribonuclease J [bacterium]